MQSLPFTAAVPESKAHGWDGMFKLTLLRSTIGLLAVPSTAVPSAPATSRKCSPDEADRHDGTRFYQLHPWQPFLAEQLLAFASFAVRSYSNAIIVADRDGTITAVVPSRYSDPTRM